MIRCHFNEYPCIIYIWILNPQYFSFTNFHSSQKDEEPNRKRFPPIIMEI